MNRNETFRRQIVMKRNRNSVLIFFSILLFLDYFKESLEIPGVQTTVGNEPDPVPRISIAILQPSKRGRYTTKSSDTVQRLYKACIAADDRNFEQLLHPLLLSQLLNLMNKITLFTSLIFSFLVFSFQKSST